MKTEFKDVAHLYLGCRLSGTQDSAGLTTRRLQEFLDEDRNDQPILRPLSDMTEDEQMELAELSDLFLPDHLFKALVNDRKYLIDVRNAWGITAYLLSKHFDLFGLIESGQAIDKTTLSQPEREEGK